MIKQELGIERLCERVDKHNVQTAESHRRSAADMGECLAEDLYKPFSQLAEGRTDYMAAFGYGKKYAEGYDNIDWST